MEISTLSSKGQVAIPAAIRTAHHWQPGLELAVIDTGDGILLRPLAAVPRSDLSEVAGMFKGKVAAKTDAEIQAAIDENVRGTWRGRH
jgi:AbrB family looped-hinge helix DNA binding protein